jgi:hypothetical protein
MEIIYMRELTAKEQLIVSAAEQVQFVVCKQSHKDLLQKYAPKGEPSGRIFSKSYKPIIQKSLFSKTKYFLLVMECGEAEHNGYLGHVTEWCQEVYQFARPVDFYNYLTYIELLVKRKNNPRITLEQVQN